MNRRLILTKRDFSFHTETIEKQIGHLDFNLKSCSPFTEFSIKLDGVIDEMKGDNYVQYFISELLREIAKRIEDKTEYEVKPWK